MTGRTHGAWGIAVGAGMAVIAAPADSVNWWLPLVGTLLAGIGALVPDMDSPKALIQEIVAEEGRKSRNVLLALLGWLVSLLVKMVSFLVRCFTRHRAATHTVWAVLVGAVLVGGIVFLVAGLVPVVQDGATVTLALLFQTATARANFIYVGYLAGAFAVGAGSHLLLDSLTVEGTRPFSPLWRGHVRLAHLKTGGPADKFLQKLGDLAAGVLLLVYLYNVAWQAGWLELLGRGVAQWLP